MPAVIFIFADIKFYAKLYFDDIKIVNMIYFLGRCTALIQTLFLRKEAI